MAIASIPAGAEDVIRLGDPGNADVDIESPETPDSFGEMRRGFDHESFEARLESLWFQRKIYLSDGRKEDAARQSQLIRAFCNEEGVKRLENLASALVSEARRHLDDGDYRMALDSLALAESFDPGRPQIHRARAAVHWKAENRVAAASAWLTAMGSALGQSMRGLAFLNQFAMVVVVALIGCVLVFAVMMIVRYQVPLRHEVEERFNRVASEPWARTAGWAVVFLPMVIWVGTGWVALFWIVVTFRFMQRAERVTAVILLAATIVAVPVHRVATVVYGITANPVVRTTVASSGGEYDPERILKLQQLVQAFPEDPVYHFLLAGLYKNGRYYEDAFVEYREALKIDPTMEQAHINVGNIFYITAQYAESVANYRKAVEIAPDSLLAYFNMHLAQSEDFRFKEAEKSLNEAGRIDSARLADMLATDAVEGGSPSVIDANLELGSVWSAALGGRDVQRGLETAGQGGAAWLPQQFANPFSIAGLLSLFACGLAVVLTRREHVARRCVRCGRPFCHFCKSSREGHEYCSQCLHLYVLGDGLAPETKTRKLYEVERYERWTRAAGRLIALVLPGSGHLLRGRAVWGTVLLLLWISALIAWQPVTIASVERLAGLDLKFDLVGSPSVPAVFTLNPIGLVSVLALVTIWIVGNVGRRRREVHH